MANNYVFLVHGMGEHSAKWSERWQTCIANNAKLFAPYADGSAKLGDDVAFEEITYDEVFDEDYLSVWQDVAGAAASPMLPPAVQIVLEEIAQSPNAKLPAFFWKSAMDVVLWATFPQAREAVVAKVTDKLMAGIGRAQADGASIHMLAHSLGTSVIHDALLCGAAKPESAKVFDPKKGGFQWKSYTTVANVSRLLTASESPSDHLGVESFRPHNSRVRPGDLVGTFVNVQHVLDPFTFPRTFKPDWGNLAFWPERPDRYDELIHIHDLETQFDHPLVARRCLRLFTGRNNLGRPAEMDAAWHRYEQKYGRSGVAGFDELKALIEPDAERKLGAGELARYLATYAKEVLP